MTSEKEVKKAALVGLRPYMPLQSGTQPRLTTSQPVYLLAVHPVTAPEKKSGLNHWLLDVY